MILTTLIWFYQVFLSPLFGTNCRYLPTCSCYAKEAIYIHGPLRGSCIALKRILRCHPWTKPMVDPVPLSPTDSNPDSKFRG